MDGDEKDEQERVTERGFIGRGGQEGVGKVGEEKEGKACLNFCSCS